MENSNLHLVLASTSPRRKELLSHLGLPFSVLGLNVPEDSTQSDPVIFSSELALRKGSAVCQKLLLEEKDKNFLVVAADTIVCLGTKIYNKPASRQEAQIFLSELSGKSHSVFTAVSLQLIVDQKISAARTFVDESRVTFDLIPAELMERYLDTGDSLDKAGAYGIQGPSLTFISKVEGSYSNVVGFPLSRFITEAKNFLQSKFKNEGSWFDLFHS